MNYNMLLGYLYSIKSGTPSCLSCNYECEFCSYCSSNNDRGVLCGKLTKENVRDIACRKIGIRRLYNE